MNILCEASGSKAFYRVVVVAAYRVRSCIGNTFFVPNSNTKVGVLPIHETVTIFQPDSNFQLKWQNKTEKDASFMLKSSHFCKNKSEWGFVFGCEEGVLPIHEHV